MGQIRKLDKEGMRSRVDKKNLSGSSWTCFKMADQTLAEIDGIVSNCSVGGITIPRYESLADSIGKLEADSKLLLNYPDGRNITNPHNIENLQEVWPWEHDLIDVFRYYTGPKPEGY